VVQRLKIVSQKLHDLTAATPNALVTPTVTESSKAPSFNFAAPERQLSAGTQQALRRRSQMQHLLLGIAELMGPSYSISAFELAQGSLVPVSRRGLTLEAI
jgi:hypothetical protein